MHFAQPSGTKATRWRARLDSNLVPSVRLFSPQHAPLLILVSADCAGNSSAQGMNENQVFQRSTASCVVFFLAGRGERGGNGIRIGRPCGLPSPEK
jgi:hypothetical protein